MIFEPLSDMPTPAIRPGYSFLDLYSTSQKVSSELLADIEFELEQSFAVQSPRCDKHAPFICYPDVGGEWHLVQGCCNSWNCSRCGQIRAREEYWRIVNGAEKLAEGEQLYFVTLTCRGADLNLETADENYLLWTNRLLSAWRASAKKRGKTLTYAQVTERQKRGAAHSHLIVNDYPPDAKPYRKGDWLPNGTIAKHDCLYSEWFVERCTSAGLGKLTDCTIVRNPVAVAVYVSKYLFKDMTETLWPKGWRRVRYSREWPKTDPPANPDAFPVIRKADWYKVAQIKQGVRCEDSASYEAALVRLITNVYPPRKVDKTYK